MKLYEVVALDECGHESVLFEGDQESCRTFLETNRDDYPEHRGFSIQRSVTQLAQEHARRMMDDEDYAYQHDQE